MKFRTFVSAFIFTIICYNADAGSISGKVVDTFGEPVAGVIVSAHLIGDTVVSEAVTGGGGGFTVHFEPVYVSDAGCPTDIHLAQNYPNPFNPLTTIPFALPREGHVTLSVFNILGQKTITLIDGVVGPGHHQVSWNGKDSGGSPVSAGIYIAALRTGGTLVTRKILLVDGGSAAGAGAPVGGDFEPAGKTTVSTMSRYEITLSGDHVIERHIPSMSARDGVLTGDITVVRVEHQGPRTLSGAVFDDAGVTLGGGTVVLTGGLGEQTFPGNPRGLYCFDGLPEGRYELSYRKDRYTLSTPPLEIVLEGSDIVAPNLIATVSEWPGAITFKAVDVQDYENPDGEPGTEVVFGELHSTTDYDLADYGILSIKNLHFAHVRGDVCLDALVNLHTGATFGYLDTGMPGSTYVNGHAYNLVS